MSCNLIFHNGVSTKLYVTFTQRTLFFHFLVREGGFRTDLQEAFYCVCKNLIGFLNVVDIFAHF